MEAQAFNLFVLNEGIEHENRMMKQGKK